VKKFILILVLILSPSVLFAEEPPPDRPHWSLEVKGGRFIPDIENWSQFYGKQYMGEYGASLAYKILRPLEVGIEGGYLRDMGQGFAPIHNVSSGSVTYKLYPVNVFILVRGIFSERQWVVPYVGGGWTRMYYWEEVEGQGIARGRTDGRHARAGLQFLLDGLDPDASGNFFRDFGVYHTYLFLETERTHAVVDTVSGSSVNLGGKSWLGGLLFEF
jgi:hypothetical protein